VFIGPTSRTFWARNVVHFFSRPDRLRRGWRGKENGKNAVEARKRAETEEEIVCLTFLKGGCDVFFCSQQSSLAKASC
jgi:hypothetical protein